LELKGYCTREFTRRNESKLSILILLTFYSYLSTKQSNVTHYKLESAVYRLKASSEKRKSIVRIV